MSAALARSHSFGWSAGPRLLASLRVSALLLALLLGVGGLILGSSAVAQTEQRLSAPRFEVASIKVDKSSEFSHHIHVSITNPAGDGRFYATNVTLKDLFRSAYVVQKSQIVGGPDWINHERFDIQAMADSSVDAELRRLSPDQGELVKRRMLQALLADRFDLKVRHETKILPVYALVVAKNGPKLKEVSNGGSAPNGVKGSQSPRDSTVLSHSGKGGNETYFTTPISTLAFFLSQQLGRTILDETGLKGRYAFTLKWTPDIGGGEMFGGSGPGGGAEPGGSGQSASAMAAPGSSDSSGPSIFTALQQQLGLKLKPTKGPVEVLVIDHVEQPSPN
jgi:uncharacterized protein (TIGR03435 family)